MSTKNDNVWTSLPKPFFVLAPMEAVTDVVFRHAVASAASPDLWFTEFTNATGWVHAGEKAIRGRLFKTDDERPIIAQIWGGEPGDMERLAMYCKELGFDGIDINMGCPVKSAIKSGGSALIRKPDVAIAAIKAAKIAGLPVSVKTRIGYSSISEWRDWVTTLLGQDLAALTLHLRTKKEMSKVPAHWEIMDDIVALRDEIAPATLIIGNGDVEDREHGQRLVDKHGIDGVMIGRGIFQNPFAFAHDSTRARSKDELLGLLKIHLDLYDQYASITTRPYDTLKRFFKVYIRGFDGASTLRGALMLTKSTTDARYFIENHQKAKPYLVGNTPDITYDVPMSKDIKAIVFDSDGTLLDTRSFVLEGYKTVLAKHGLEHLANDNYIRQRLGKPVPETYEQIIAGHNTRLSIEELCIEHDSVQNAMLDLIKPYPHTEALLHSWKKAGIKLCLFTSGNMAMVRRNFKAAGMENVDALFDAIITADDNLARKPEPDAINEVLLRVGVAPQNAVVVGDFAYDMMAASRAHAGLKIGILHGFGTQKELLDAGAEFLCDNLISLNHLMSFSSSR